MSREMSACALRRSAASARACGEAENDGDHEILGDEDREHEVDLVVREATEVR
jgi:hypothetical protein